MVLKVHLKFPSVSDGLMQSGPEYLEGLILEIAALTSCGDQYDENVHSEINNQNLGMHLKFICQRKHRRQFKLTSIS
jgi:hypothetical protein